MKRLRLVIFCLTLAAAMTVFMVDRGPPEGLAPARADDEVASEPVFDPDLIKPPVGSALEAVMRARRAGDVETTRALAVSAIGSATEAEGPSLRWMAAQAARELEAPHEAADLLLPVATSTHPLARWARLFVAEWLESKDPGTSLALLDALLAPVLELQAWPGRQSAERLRARVLARLGRREEAIATFERFVSETPDESLAIQAVIPLAELLAEGSEMERVRALSLYRRVAHRVPQTRVGVRSEERAREILKALPEPLRREHREPSIEDKLLRADALLAELRYPDAANAYAALEKQASSDPRLVCRARYGRAKALLDGRARSEGSELMAQVAEECDQDADRRAWARYQAGRAFSALGQNDAALAQYEALEREAPAHRLADDALFRAAKVARDMGDLDGVYSRLSALPVRYPDGDMRARARFSLAWQAYSQGDLGRAIDALAADDRDEAAEDLLGRQGYWRGRWLAESGDEAEAVKAFAATFERGPLSYYGQQAYARLETLDPGRARDLIASLSRTAEEKLLFDQRPELAKPGFLRALALFSVGDANLGVAELRASGFLSDASDPELTFLTAALLDRTGALHMAVDTARRRMQDLLSRPPRGRNLALYELVYPAAFAPLIEDATRRENVPCEFVRAVAREESGFYPRAVSRAHAYGLIQVLEPTARVIAKGLKLPHDPASLARPEVNLALGTRFISTLAASVRGQYALVPAAYNAGPSAVARWLSERKNEPLDVWIENIPYDETRQYTRRVIQSYGVYTWLKTGELLRLPLELPAL